MKSNHVLIPVEYDSEWCQPPRPWPASPSSAKLPWFVFHFRHLSLALLSLFSISLVRLHLASSQRTKICIQPESGLCPTWRVTACPMTLAIVTHFQRVYAVQAELCTSPLSLNVCVFPMLGDLIIKTIFVLIRWNPPEFPSQRLFVSVFLHLKLLSSPSRAFF